jgi:L-lactate dehydrogenase
VRLRCLDVNADLAAGQALDILHGGPSVADQSFRRAHTSMYRRATWCASRPGLRRKPDESRLDLINRNTDLFVQILQQVKAAGLKPSAKVLVVSNPVDILTYVAAKSLGLPEQQVIGLGTQLDTIRFCSLIADHLKAPATQTRALILGEHGDSMVPIWSSATVGGLPLEKYPNWNNNTGNQIFTRTKGSGAEVIGKKGGAGFAVGIAIRDVIESILLDSRKILPVSTVQSGCYGIRDVALSVPTVVGSCGAVDRIELELWPKEMQGLRSSASALRPTLETVLKRVGKI